MTTTQADPNTSRLAAMRTLLSGAEWARVAAMVGVIVALHHYSVGGKAVGVRVGLTAYTLGLGHGKARKHRQVSWTITSLVG
jgi:high-affinity nickel-transport protein